jgi:hypothetical protein
MTDDNDEAWLKGLRGEQSPADPALRREVAAVRRAVSVTDSVNVRQDHDLGKARLFKRLKREGLLGSGSLRPWLVMAASVMFVAIGFRALRPDQGVGVVPPGVPAMPAERPRGVAGAIKLEVPDTEQAASSLLAELQDLGFVARRSPREDRVIVEIEVGSSQLAAFRAWAEPRGGQVNEPGIYRLLIDPLPVAPDRPGPAASP